MACGQKSQKNLTENLRKISYWTIGPLDDWIRPLYPSSPLSSGHCPPIPDHQESEARGENPSLPFFTILYPSLPLFTLNVQSSMFNPQCSMFNPQCSILNVQSSMFNILNLSSPFSTHQWPIFVRFVRFVFAKKEFSDSIILDRFWIRDSCSVSTYNCHIIHHII